MKVLLVLVGPKGAGKSTIGQLLAEELGIHFLRVEPLFLEVRERLGAAHPDLERAGFEAALAGVEDALSRSDTVCIESTGASAQFGGYLVALRRLARVLCIRVVASPEQCLARVRGRSSARHIPVSDDRVELINAVAARVSLPWSAELDNGGSLAPEVIVGEIRTLLASAGATEPGTPARVRP